MESKGLGDTIDKITTATGIKSVVNGVVKVTKKGCGCARRREQLNKKYPYASK